jgi:hypothetical protein
MNQHMFSEQNNNLHELSYGMLDALRAEAANNGGRAITNAFTQPTSPLLSQLPQGIQFFEFDTVGRQVFPIVTPLVNRIPRIGPVGGVANYWREITDINSNKVLPGVSEGNRGAVVARSTRDRITRFAGLGMENVNTFEAVYAARGVANPQELARLDALKSLKMAEERVMLYGNGAVIDGKGGIKLGIPTAPTGVDSVCAAGETSTMTTRAAVVGVVVALTGEGLYLSSVSGGVATTVTRNNADGSTDIIGGGSSNKSAASAAIAVTAGHKVTWTWPDVPGALGYAIYTGANLGAARLAGIVSINKFVQFADESGATQLASAITADNSTNDLEFPGVLTIAQDITNNQTYYKSFDGKPLTADSTGNITEFVALFYDMFQKYLFGPSELMMSALLAYNVTKILLGGPAAAIYQKFIDQSDNMVGGFYVTRVLNPFTGDMVKLTVHPVHA